MKILIAEKTQEYLSLLESVVSDAIADAEIVSTLHGKELEEIVQSEAVDVAFVSVDGGIGELTAVAEKLRKQNNRVNIIVVANDGSLLREALRMHVSDYLQRPINADAVSGAMSNLLYKIKSQDAKIFAHTFGNFDLFVNGKIVYFAREKSKEMLAYLVDRNGASVSRKEIFGILFEDRPYDRGAQGYLSKIYGELLAGLKRVGAENLLVKKHNLYAVDKSKFTCDAYDFVAGKEKAIKSFADEYMVQYEWAEISIGKFYR